MARQRKNPRKNNEFLADLVLWRNDSEHVAEIQALAEAGYVDAQYALGLIYTEGRGIVPDQVQAYVWLSRAIQQGDSDAELLRQVVQQQMSFEQIRIAESHLSGITLN